MFVVCVIMVRPRIRQLHFIQKQWIIFRDCSARNVFLRMVCRIRHSVKSDHTIRAEKYRIMLDWTTAFWSGRDLDLTIEILSLSPSSPLLKQHSKFILIYAVILLLSECLTCLRSDVVYSIMYSIMKSFLYHPSSLPAWWMLTLLERRPRYPVIIISRCLVVPSVPPCNST